VSLAGADAAVDFDRHDAAVEFELHGFAAVAAQDGAGVVLGFLASSFVNGDGRRLLSGTGRRR
jgi:hypothetical protein